MISKRRWVPLLFLVCAAPRARAEDWSGLGADEQLSRHTPEQSAPLFVPAWTYVLGGGKVLATPVTSGGRVVVAGSDGPIAALDARDGSVAWTRTLAGGVRATPAVSNDQVAVPTLAGMLVSLRLDDGQIAWQRPFGGQNQASAQLVRGATPGQGDTLVLGAGFPQQDVWRLDARTGEPLWHTAKGEIADLVSSTAAVTRGLAVVGMNGGRFQALDLATGATAWKLDAGGPVYLSSPLAVDDRVYAFPGDAQARLFGVEADTGAPLPGFPVAIPDPAPVAGAQRLGRGPAVSSPMSAGGLIIVQLRRDELLPSTAPSPPVSMREYAVAIDPASAQVRWQVPVAAATAETANGVPELVMCATPVGFSNGDGSFVALSSSITGRVVVLDAGTGQEVWTAPLPSAGRSSPVLSNGLLLVATDGGAVHAFASTSNHAPAPPAQVGPADGQLAFSEDGVRVDWQGATDVEDGPLSYVVRVERDDAPDTRVETRTAPGEDGVKLALDADARYLVAVRSRDAQGALSPWSPARRLLVSGARPAGDGTLVDTTSAPTTQTSPPPPPAATASSAPPVPPVPLCQPAVQAASGDQPLTERGGCAVSGGGAGSGALPGLALTFALAARRRRRAGAGRG